MKEIWKPVKGFEQYYSVSNMGNVRSEPRHVNGPNGKRKIMGKLLRPYDNGNGYLGIHFHVERKRTVHYVHRLVAESFIENPKNLPEVNHLDYDRKNNIATNLEWCTDQENTRHSSPHMRKPKKTSKTNTGEKYISFRESRNEYRLTIAGMKEQRFKTLEDAVRKRRELIGE